MKEKEIIMGEIIIIGIILVLLLPMMCICIVIIAPFYIKESWKYSEKLKGWRDNLIYCKQ